MLTHVMSRGCIANRASFLYPPPPFLPNRGLRYCSRCLLTVHTIPVVQRNSGLYARFRMLLPPGTVIVAVKQNEFNTSLSKRPTINH